MLHIAAGIDPGLVDTGIVLIAMDDQKHMVDVHYRVVNRGDGAAVRQALDQMPYSAGLDKDCKFIEAYRPRSHFSTDARMTELVNEIKTETKGKVLSNSGAKKVVKNNLLHVLGLQGFPTTHHADLQAAARIMVLGMFKDDTLNRVVADCVKAYCGAKPWTVNRP